MLETLTKKINQDENDIALKEAMVECSQIGTMHSDIEKVAFIKDMTQVDTDDLKSKLAKVDFCKDCPLEDNMEKLVQAAKAPLTESVLIESVVSTSKTLTITKEDYDELKKAIKELKNESISIEDKKTYTKKIKAFLRACIKGVAKCHDDKPADAFVIAVINSLCTLYDCKPDLDEGVTKKAAFIIKLNALSKAVK